MVEKIIIIGTGNLGTQLALKAYELNIKVVAVYSRSYERAQELAGLVDAKAVKSFNELPNADAIFLTVPDGQIKEIFRVVCHEYTYAQQTLWVHCSGATPLDALNEMPNYAVFYPLQTFTKHTTPPWYQIPIFIEANTAENLKTIQDFANQFSTVVWSTNSQERLNIHCGAVLVSNFVHALAHAALNVSKQNDFNKIYFPLLKEAVRKLEFYSPLECLTGPALRNDLGTLSKHIQLIENPRIRSIYEELTAYIQAEMRK